MELLEFCARDMNFRRKNIQETAKKYYKVFRSNYSVCHIVKVSDVWNRKNRTMENMTIANRSLRF